MYQKTITELAAGLRAGEFSSEELTRSCLDRIEEHDAKLNCVVTLTESAALEAAKAADKRLQQDDATLLTGIPYLHKDIFCTLGVRTSCGSRMLDNFEAPYDATVTAQLQAAGHGRNCRQAIREFHRQAAAEHGQERRANGR